MATHANPVVTGGTLRPVREDEYRSVAGLFDQRWETFRWKYLENPWCASPAVHVLEGTDGLRGAIGWVRLRLDRLRGTSEAVLPGDVALPQADAAQVGRSINRSFEVLSEPDVDLALSAPLPHEVPAQRVVADGERTSPLTTYLQVRRPSTIADGLSPIDPIVRRAVDGLLRVRQYLEPWTRALADGPIDVERRDGVPPVAFRILEGAPAPGLGAVRGRPFWRWRLADPRTTFRTFLLFRHGAPIAGTVVGARRGPRAHVAIIHGIGRAGADAPGVARLLAAVFRHCEFADLVYVPESSLPDGRLERLGVRRTRQWPVSLIAPRRAQWVRAFGSNGAGTYGRLGQLGLAERSI